MKKYRATLLLAMLVALGTGQAVPLSSVRRDREPSAIVQVLKQRREQRVRREGAPRAVAIPESTFFCSIEPPIVIPAFWSARLLRAPPVLPLA